MQAAEPAFQQCVAGLLETPQAGHRVRAGAELRSLERANMLMGRAEDAIPWLQKSIAITSASGRTHMLLAAAYQQLGRIDDARAVMQKGMELRPGSTYGNVPTPKKNSSPIYIEATEKIMQLMVAAGLPAS
jgi:Tfp pilus assembly protein PilF